MKVSLIGFVETRGKIDIKNIKIFDLSPWCDDLLLTETGKPEREAGLGGGLKLGIELWPCQVSVPEIPKGRSEIGGWTCKIGV